MHPTPGDMKGPALPPDAVKAKRQTLYLLLGAAFLGIALFFGNFHVVQSEKGTAIVQKVHFTFSETFVSLDAITGQPLIAAKSQNPLAVKALQRDGLIETDQQMQDRVQKEVQEQFEKSQLDLQVQQVKAELQARTDLAISSVKTASSDFGWKITGVITNKGAVPYQFIRVEYPLYADDGVTVVDSAMDLMTGTLLPGQKWKFEAVVLNDQAKRYGEGITSGQPIQ